MTSADDELIVEDLRIARANLRIEIERLSFRRGELTVLLGESGVGKSSVGAAIAGATVPNASFSGRRRLGATARELGRGAPAHERMARAREVALADQFGVIDVDPEDPSRIRAFLEKPTDPQGLPDSPDEVLASMGNYVFSTDALIEAVTRDADLEDSKHDMGGDIIPAFVERGEAFVYDFKDNEIPGAEDRDRGYWRDVGTIDSYFDAHMDLVSIHPIFNLYNDRWPIHTTSGMSLPPAKFVQGGLAQESIVGAGSILSAATVRNSVLSSSVMIDAGATVEGSVIMPGVRIGRNAVVRNAILDKNVVVSDGEIVGVDEQRDRERFAFSNGGVVAIGKGVRV